ncbi:LLM class flavin-dependent oxidoreductase [Mesorhizobium sp. M1405]|uniref:LLM class flavin-dependent oxidoreductase n=1 Tax=unclassified Mesorhizobium TaxID=325217 RepID=UPI00333D4017
MPQHFKIDHIGFLTPGNSTEDRPLAGLEDTLKLFEFGESLGFDSAWIRHRHLERGVSSAPVFLAAATQRTTDIQLGSAVIQMGYENPFRLAEDLAMVDVLSGGRLNVGLSAGSPPHAKLLGRLFLDGDPSSVDYSHARAERLAESLRSDLLGDDKTVLSSALGDYRPRVQPVAVGLTERLWYGGGSLRSAEWAAKNGFNLLIGNVTTGEKTDDFFEAQLNQLQLYCRNWNIAHRPRIGFGRVIVPFDSADRQTRERYRAYAASRHARTLQPNGERRTLFARDIIGTSEEILDQLADDPILPLVDEFRMELPYDFPEGDYRQVMHDFVHAIAPVLGWRRTDTALREVTPERIAG